MAHLSIITCDLCGKEAKTDGVPYPDGWVLATITSWRSELAGGQRTRKNEEKDICPDCAVPVLIDLKLKTHEE